MSELRTSDPKSILDRLRVAHPPGPNHASKFDCQICALIVQLEQESVRVTSEVRPSNPSDERARMEAFYNTLSLRDGVTVGWGRDSKTGTYHASFARNAWAAWQEAQRPVHETPAPPAKLDFKAFAADADELMRRHGFTPIGGASEKATGVNNT